jgi:hypothetical protein
MSPGERQTYIAEQGARRQALQKKIEELGGKRQAYIEEKVRQEAGKGADSLDAQIYSCIKAQAAEKEIRYTGGPVY